MGIPRSTVNTRSLIFVFTHVPDFCRQRLFNQNPPFGRQSYEPGEDCPTAWWTRVAFPLQTGLAARGPIQVRRSPNISFFDIIGLGFGPCSVSRNV